ncbi:hypothetical protein OROHE_020033 [Orobanche hederae]
MEKQDSKKKPNILPFVEGGLTGLLASSCTSLGISLVYNLGYYTLTSQQNATITSYFRQFPAILFINTTTRTAQLGSFMTLKQRLEAANGGRPLNLYQEACCGMAAGATEAFFGSPIYLARRRIETNGTLISVQQSYFRYLMLELCHTAMDKGVVALWRGGGYYAFPIIGYSTGMLASYGRSVRYFEDSCGLSKSKSQLGGAVFSGFFASACSLPCKNIAYAVLRDKKKYQGKNFLYIALKSWELCGLQIFYKGFLKHFLRTSPSVVVTWVCFEDVRYAMNFIT